MQDPEIQKILTDPVMGQVMTIKAIEFLSNIL